MTIESGERKRSLPAKSCECKMAQLTKTEFCNTWTISRPTLDRWIKDGKISVEKDTTGRTKINTDEALRLGLFARVFSRVTTQPRHRSAKKGLRDTQIAHRRFESFKAQFVDNDIIPYPDPKHKTEDEQYYFDFYSYLPYKKCVRCGVTKPITEFWNKSGKDTTLNSKRSHCKPCAVERDKQKRLANPQKARKTYDRKNKNKNAKRKRRAYHITKLKLKMGCVDCGYNANATALQFDHIDPSKKVGNISTLMYLNLKKLFIEIRKCEIRCATCHAEKTDREQDHLVRREC